ncbi:MULTISPECIES: glycosyltransferase [unclassified Methylobacterium]|uniref:glycosyltransferase family 2 protein n=1 Tax=unclassified Methylobacterium TaxID=2615210 RepID=UPI00226A28D8|nr:MULTISPECIES: glycosyltransferase [unclassified Methylobacterium]
MSARARLCVIFATVGRPADIERWTSLLQNQSQPPETVIYSVTCAEDLPSVEKLYPHSSVVVGDRGLAKQRNRALELAVSEHDIIVFFDDDFVPSNDWLVGVVSAFSAYPEVVGIDGLVIADGINSGEIPFATALDLVEKYADDDSRQGAPPIRQTGLYGCNMSFRASAIEDTRFDENLPLYGWQEDVDFSSRLKCRGKLLRVSSSFGVHRGVRGARLNGFSLGYSQIANPLYLFKKKSVSLKFTVSIILRNIAMNHLRSLRPEDGIDRRGRLRGNWCAAFDLIRLKIHPTRILEFQ